MAEQTWASFAAAVDEGDWETAVDQAVRLAAGDTVPSPPAAWRAAMVLYLQDDLDAAESVLVRAGDDADDEQRAMMAAWRASIGWARGDVADCGRHAARALVLAQQSGRPRALASAHTVQAMHAASTGDRRANDRHYALALRAAERAGDRNQQIRVRANLASQRLEEGDGAGSQAELDQALQVAGDHRDVHPSFLGLVQHNRAQLLLRAGRLTEARDGFRAATTTSQRAGVGFIANPLTGLGECYELRGGLPQARTAYEEAIEVAEHAGNAQTLVPALSGLARVLAALGDDRAHATAQRAVDGATGLTEPIARAAAGWAALAAGDRPAAREFAAQTLELARGSRNFTALAEGLELEAMAEWPGGAFQRLTEAATVWKDLGDQVSAARAELAWARSAGGPAEVVADARLRALGADPASGTRSLAARSRTGAAPVVRLLGSFAVVHDGQSVPAASWQSRKARDLLKLLIARRGRPITRQALGEALWPGQEGTANRLSITLSVLRTVLDPKRQAAPDSFVAADASGVRYDPAHLRVDVDTFLQLAAAAAAAARSGETDRARTLYAAADEAYTGDVLDDEPDFEAVSPLRDEARAAFLGVTRALGDLAAQARDVDGAVRAWLRLLEADPYDEDCALRLIGLLTARGRHGEAARHHRRYAERMRELDAPVVPLSSL